LNRRTVLHAFEYWPGTTSRGVCPNSVFDCHSNRRLLFRGKDGFLLILIFYHLPWSKVARRRQPFWSPMFRCIMLVVPVCSLDVSITISDSGSAGSACILENICCNFRLGFGQTSMVLGSQLCPVK
jgi:hypothetical protein